jgi:ketosteroid isomerase-like protein
MNEQDNVATIQRMFEAFGRGDIESIIGNCTEDCEFHSIGPATVPYYGIHKGKDAIRNHYFAAMMSTQSDQNLAVERFVAQGDTVVALGRYSAAVKATGKTMESPVALIFDLREGKVRRFEVMGDTAAAQAAYSGATAAGR